MKLFEGLRLADIRSTTTFRLAFLFGLLFTIGIVALGSLIYAITATELTARSDQILRQEATRLLLVPLPDLPQQIRAEVERNERGLDYFALLSSSGVRIEGNIQPDRSLVPDKPKDVEARDGRGPMRLLAVRTYNNETILLGRDISEIRYLLRRMFEIILVSGLAITPAILLIGAILSLGALRRIRNLEQASSMIAAGHLDVRMPIAGRNDELDKIAATVNAMVQDLERVVAQVKNVTDGIAHDLRTPLSRVRSLLDEARSLPDLAPRIADIIDESVGDLDVVLERFTALLRISELEASERRSGFVNVRVAALVNDVKELYDPVAEEMGIDLIKSDIDVLAEIYADPNLLFEALSNLVDNAIKFARRIVSISVVREDGMTIVKIEDDGLGIPLEERDAVLRRFYRRASDRSRPGTGLGLSVVSAILHVHRFKLDLGDAEPGLIARISMPADR